MLVVSGGSELLELLVSKGIRVHHFLIDISILKNKKFRPKIKNSNICSSSSSTRFDSFAMKSIVSSMFLASFLMALLLFILLLKLLLLVSVLLHLVHHQLLKGRLLDLHVVGVGLHSCGDHLLFSI